MDCKRINVSAIFLLTGLISVSCKISAAVLGAQGFTINTQLILLSNSNIERNINEISDDEVKFVPQISYVNVIGKHQVNLSYSGQFTQYSKLSQYNYQNNTAEVGILFDHSPRLSTKFTANYTYKSEEPGSTNGVLSDVTEFNQLSQRDLSATVFYGSEKGIGQAVLGVNYNNADYKNNNQRFRNVDTTSIQLQFFYRIASSTRLFIDVGAIDSHYTNVNITNNQANLQNNYFTGIEWVSSEQTTSSFKLGYQSKDFENAEYINTDGLSYQLDFTWRPKRYTKLNFGAAKSAKESDIQGAAGFVSKSYSIELQHDLSKSVALNSSIQLVENDIEIRTNTNNSFQLGLTYNAKTWLDIKLSYANENRESNEPLFNYDAEILQLLFITKFD